MSFNTKANLCSTLSPGQSVCCSAGTLPDLRPRPNSDGSCSVYITVKDDYCWKIAAAYGLGPDDLESFNKNTWGWNGCSNLFPNIRMSLSTGTPPMPAAVTGNVCGPQAPGTQRPSTGVSLASLNPCPLNACCDVWGQCGTTAEFCTPSGTGAPGTAAPNTNGCISNCGTALVKSAPPFFFIRVGYFQGYNLNRPCLNMDASQIDVSKYTHIHFSFATLTADFQVSLGDTLTQYEFQSFLALKNTKRTLSFGGWSFSTDQSTFALFRSAFTSANRQNVDNNIAKFAIENNLDGVDIDWEYPGLSAPDIPGIPTANPEDGENYLAFLSLLKAQLPGKTVSIAAPASYWYLKGFPIQKIGQVVDYIIYMAYDLHGQWDYGNKWSDPGCPSGNCLRSNVNLTETMNALVMITKAGVPSYKIIVGVTSYGRSHQMTSPGCTGESCTYTGPQSGATPGRCTQTGGYISDAEIREIIAQNSNGRQWVDIASQTDILVYNNDQWIGWMSPETKASRIKLYEQNNMGGVSDWAVDMQAFQPMPPHMSDWGSFKKVVQENPRNTWIVGDRTGTWATIQCDIKEIANIAQYLPQDRWKAMDCDHAWADAIAVWNNIDRPSGNLTFTKSLSNTFHGVQGMDCVNLEIADGCNGYVQCHVDAGSGAGAYEVLNSLMAVHRMLSNLHEALYQAQIRSVTELDTFTKTFAPIPDKNSANSLLLDLLSLGLTVVAAPIFNSYLRETKYFAANAGKLDNMKDITYSSLATTISIAKDRGADPKTWTDTQQGQFIQYMGQIFSKWEDSTVGIAGRLFDGSPASIDILWKLIQDGQMIEGSANGKAGVSKKLDVPAIRQLELRAFFGFVIPQAWTVSGTAAFVINSGLPCNAKDPLSSYIGTRVPKDASACVGDKLYFLMAPKGRATDCTAGAPTFNGAGPPCVTKYFSVPPGLDSLVNGTYGGVTGDDLIRGAVNSFNREGKNGGKVIDPSNRESYDQIFDMNIQAPGYIILPVCGPKEAFTNWDNTGVKQSPNYPCN